MSRYTILFPIVVFKEEHWLWFPATRFLHLKKRIRLQKSKFFSLKLICIDKEALLQMLPNLFHQQTCSVHLVHLQARHQSIQNLLGQSVLLTFSFLRTRRVRSTFCIHFYAKLVKSSFIYCQRKEMYICFISILSS